MLTEESAVCRASREGGGGRLGYKWWLTRIGTILSLLASYT